MRASSTQSVSTKGTTTSIHSNVSPCVSPPKDRTTTTVESDFILLPSCTRNSIDSDKVSTLDKSITANRNSLLILNKHIRKLNDACYSILEADDQSPYDYSLQEQVLGQQIQISLRLDELDQKYAVHMKEFYKLVKMKSAF